MSLSRVPICAVCKTKKDIRRCQACKVVFYCGQEHQIMDRDAHKWPCIVIKKFHKNILSQTFPLDVGLFHGDIDSVLKRCNIFRYDEALVKAYLDINTFTAVEKALNHSMDVLLAFRVQHMDWKYISPTLMLRLGRDQQCYDFVKWYATTGRRGDLDWNDMRQPYLNTANSNYLEDVTVFIKNSPKYIYHVMLVVLIKIRLLQHTDNLWNSMFLYQILPTEIADEIRNMVVDSTVAKEIRIMRSKDLQKLRVTLESQLKQLYRFVKSNNEHIWPGVLKPEVYLAAVVHNDVKYIDRTTHGGKEQVKLIIKLMHECFIETPGAVSKIGELGKLIHEEEI